MGSARGRRRALLVLAALAGGASGSALEEGVPTAWGLPGYAASPGVPLLAHAQADPEQHYGQHKPTLGWNARNVRHIAPQGFRAFEALPRGRWRGLPGGAGRLWELDLSSEGAASQILVFSHVYLPDDWELAAFAPGAVRNGTVCGEACFWVRGGSLRRTTLTVPPIAGSVLRLQLYAPASSVAGEGREDEEDARPWVGSECVGEEEREGAGEAEREEVALVIGSLMQELPHFLPEAAARAAEARRRRHSRRRTLLQGTEKVVSAQTALAPAPLAAAKKPLPGAVGGGQAEAPDTQDLPANGVFLAGTSFNIAAIQQTEDEIGMCTPFSTCDPAYDTVGRAVVNIYAIHLELGSMAVCTGTIVNGPFGRYYLLTADHCFVGKDDPSNFQYWLLIFDYTQPCAGGAPPPMRKVIQGVTLLYYDSRADILLLDISEYIPDSFKPYVLGYDGSAKKLPKAAVALHHPNGNVRYISYVNGTNGGSMSTTFVAARFPTGEIQPTSATHVQIKWSYGVTQGGSSGSPLIDVATKRVVGVLTGGFSTCRSPSAADYYGLLSAGWDNGLEHYLSNKPPNELLTKQFATYLEDIANGVVTVRVTEGAEMAPHGVSLGVYPGVLTFSPEVTRGSFSYYLTDPPAENETIHMDVSINGLLPGNGNGIGDVSRVLRVSRTAANFTLATYNSNRRYSITVSVEGTNKTRSFPPGSLARFQLVFRLTSDQDPNFMRISTLKGILQSKQGDYREFPALRCSHIPCTFTNNDTDIPPHQLAIIHFQARNTTTAGLRCCLQAGMLPGVTLSVYENRILSWTLSSDPFGDPNCLHIVGIPITNGTDYHLVVSDADSLQAVLPMSVITIITGGENPDGDPEAAAAGPVSGPEAPLSATKGRNITLPPSYELLALARSFPLGPPSAAPGPQGAYLPATAPVGAGLVAASPGPLLGDAASPQGPSTGRSPLAAVSNAAPAG